MNLSLLLYMFCYPFIVQYIQYILAYLNVCEFNIRILLLGKEKVFFYAEFIKSCVKSEYIGKGTGKILYRKLLSGDYYIKFIIVRSTTKKRSNFEGSRLPRVSLNKNQNLNKSIRFFIFIKVHTRVM